MTRTLPSGRPQTETPVEPCSGVQAGAESVAAPLVGADAPNVEVLTHLQPVNAVGELAVLARLLDASTKISVLQSDAALVSARGIDHLPRWNGAVRVNPVPPPSVGSRGMSDLLAIASLLCWVRTLP